MTAVEQLMTNGGEVGVPVTALLYAHDGIDSRMMCAHDQHEGKAVLEGMHFVDVPRQKSKELPSRSQ